MTTASSAAIPFADRLAERVRRLNTPVMVGLDPRFEQLPRPLKSGIDPRDCEQVASAYEAFCRGVIDVVADLVPVVKPQSAFFEELGPPGMFVLQRVIGYAQQRGLLVVLDAKRGDIGTTAAAYAQGMLGPGGLSRWGADALTVNPYLGDDSLTPFVDVARQRGAGLFVLVKTSNPGGKMLQDLVADGRTIYEHVAQHVESLAQSTRAACGYGAVGAVVGATYPEELAKLRRLMPSAWLLVPGYGSQGAGAADVAGAFDNQGLGAVINNSRALIFAHSRPEFANTFGDARWQDALFAATQQMIAELRAVRQ